MFASAPSPEDSIHGSDPRAGDKHRRDGNEHFILAPAPLPADCQLSSSFIGNFDHQCLGFGHGSPKAFQWECMLGSGIMGGVGSVVFFFILLFVAELSSDSAERNWDWFWFVMGVITKLSLGLCVGCQALGFGFWLYIQSNYRKPAPVYFNRERREACFFSAEECSPLIIPWEEVRCEISSENVAGLSSISCMMVITYEKDDVRLQVPVPCGSKYEAIGMWETVRAYMEYEINEPADIPHEEGLREPGDPIYEGPHTFRNSRARVHRLYKAGKWDSSEIVLWYLYHGLTLWTLPFHLAAWENRRIGRMKKDSIPQEHRAWFAPLPREQWAKPSAKLMRMSANVRKLRGRFPEACIFELFQAAYQEEDRFSKDGFGHQAVRKYFAEHTR